MISFASAIGSEGFGGGAPGMVGVSWERVGRVAGRISTATLRQFGSSHPVRIFGIRTDGGRRKAFGITPPPSPAIGDTARDSGALSESFEALRSLGLAEIEHVREVVV
jgi:hypothetical protein